jgi:hypothetical protein
VSSCPLRSRIVEVGFTDQPGDKALFSGVRSQFVNLSNRHVLRADSIITSANQLGRRPPIYIRVTPPQHTMVRVKLTRILLRGGFPSGSHRLSARERGLSHLGWASIEVPMMTDARGELLMEPGFGISALGGGHFRVAAALAGQDFVTSPNTVRVVRRIYVRPVVRYNASLRTGFAALRAVRNQLRRLNIAMSHVRSARGGELGVCEESSLTTSLISIGRNALRSTRGHRDKLQPHSIAVILGEFITDPITPVRFRLSVRPDARGRLPATVNVPLRKNRRQYILVPLDDGSQFASGELTGRGGLRGTVTAAHVTAGLDAFSRQLTVNLSHLQRTFARAAEIRLTLRVKAIRSWAVGWAYRSHPVIYLNMRDPSTDSLLSATRAEALVIHEVGHKLHLTAPGDAGQPDRQANHYPSFNQHGVRHTGPHCKTGVAAGTDLWTDAAHNAASCTMWGSLKGVTAMCDECKTTLRKVDLSGGF